MNKTQYHEYLKSNEWKLKRKEVFKYHGQNCKKCDGNIGINIHHRTYVRLGRESLEEDLIPLCPSCHEKVHKIVKLHQISIWEATQRFLEEKSTRDPIKKILSKQEIRRWKYRKRLAPVKSDHRIKQTSLVDIQKLKEMYNLKEIPQFLLQP